MTVIYSFRVLTLLAGQEGHPPLKVLLRLSPKIFWDAAQPLGKKEGR